MMFGASFFENCEAIFKKTPSHRIARSPPGRPAFLDRH
jgi:hypothetical protein